MCGIAGIIGIRKIAGVERLDNMLNHISHRGPDNIGVFQDGNVHLGHCRLSIIDLSFNANQPMVQKDSAVIIYNGEIYNFFELRRDLELEGYAFRSTSDTEVLLLGYLHWGEDIVNKVKGFFSFAIWDITKQMLFCARDPFGKKPFYYYWDKEKLVFASEVEAVVTGIGFRPELNYEGLSNYLLNGYFEPGHSVYKNIYTIKAGHILKFDIKKRHLEKYPYYVPKFSLGKVNINYHDAMLKSEKLIDQAVNKRLIADVPLGTLLSGGVDSSLITLLASKRTCKSVNAFTISFEDKKYDESSYAKEVANRTNISHKLINASSIDLELILPKLIKTYGEPFGDYSAIPTYQIFEAIRPFIKVVLTGDGGDEVFGGYRGADMFLLRGKMQPFLKFFSFLFYGWPDVFLYSKHRFMRGLSHASISMHFSGADAFYSLFRDGWTKSWRRRLMRKSGWIKTREGALEENFRNKYEASGENDMESYLNLKLERLTQLFLVKVDRASMAHSIEARCPMLDIDLFNFVSRLPKKILFHDNIRKSIPKLILAQNMGKRFAYRMKMGFTPPLPSLLRNSRTVKWMEGKLLNSDGIVYDLFKPEAIKWMINSHSKGINHTTRLWNLLFLEEWYEEKFISDKN